MCGQINPGDDSCRECIGIRLFDTLKIEHRYLCSMYVNRCNSFNYYLATIGMLFTDTLIDLPHPAQGPLLLASPQIRNNIPLKDTVNWVLVQDTFIPTGNKVYLTIGNFN